MWIIQLIITALLIHSSLAQNEITAGSKDTLEETHGKIIHTSVLFRHGERTPTSMYPTDPYPATLWPEGLGQITKAGKLTLYHVGKWFRERYLDIGLKEGYHYDKLLMNSSDYDRTLMSGEVFLAGLLPPNEDEMWADDGLKWQPIPVHAKPLSEDPEIGQVVPCDRYNLEKYDANQSPELQSYYQTNQKFLEYVAEQSGYNISSSNILSALEALAHVYSSFLIEQAENLQLPSWASNVYPEPLTSMYSMFLVSLSLTSEMQRLKAGPTLASIISDMQQKQSGSFNQTFHFYSGHDTTIVSLLYTMGLYDNKPPPYGAALMFELRQKDEEYIVTILYRNETGREPYLLSLADCGDNCTLDKFVEVTKQWIPDDYTEECQVGWLERLFTYSKVFFTILMCVVLLLIFAILVYCVLLCVRGVLSSREYESL